MSSAKVVLAAGLAAICLAACGTTAKPQAGSQAALVKSKKGLDDPRKKHIECLHQEHISVRREYLDGNDPSFQVGVRPTGPTVIFLSSPGAAQYAQIDGSAQGAEVIWSALVYPNQAPDKLLSKVETCVAKGVQG
jgi:hypothetical protein